MGEITERFAEVCERARISYRRAGHAPGEPRIVCVTKKQSIDRVAEVIEAGALEIGENYLQEAVGKGVFDLRSAGMPVVRYIGRMQSNKYNPILRLFDAVDSADPGILERIRDHASCTGIQAHEFLLEVNAGEETQKGGLSITQIREFAAAPAPWLREISGFMAVVPLEATAQVRARMYDDVHDLFAELVRRPELQHLRILSMGTSDDFELALEHGSTMIRVGTAIFGPRPRSLV